MPAPSQQFLSAAPTRARIEVIPSVIIRMSHSKLITNETFQQTNFSLAASFWEICQLSVFILLRRLKLASVSIFHPMYCLFVPKFFFSWANWSIWSKLTTWTNFVVYVERLGLSWFFLWTVTLCLIARFLSGTRHRARVLSPEEKCLS